MARKSLMSIDFDQLKTFVKEAMFTGGGINTPSAPVGVPHEMPASDNDVKMQNMGDPKSNKLYDAALKAREATEELVEALDDPIYDDAYEHAFKASASLRRVLNSLEGEGAYPMPDQRVVAPPPDRQKYFGTGGHMPMTFSAGGELEEQDMAKLGQQRITKSAFGRGKKEQGKAVMGGTTMKGVDNVERGMIQQIEQLLTKLADEGNLRQYRPILQQMMRVLTKRSAGKGEQK